MTAREIEALFTDILFDESEGANSARAMIRLREDSGSEVVQFAATWCKSADPLKRSTAVNVLGKLASSESYALVTGMLERDADPEVIACAISALGHLRDDRAIPWILPHASDPAEDVRFCVACALGSFANDARAIRVLLELTADSDSEVRDWAVFGLSVQGDADSPEIREALLRCLDDEDVSVREEAAVGLARRRDERVVPKLLEMLAQDGPDVKIRVAEAAVTLLGLGKDPVEWRVGDYQGALQNRFGY
jgi:HEAT repeat protein